MDEISIAKIINNVDTLNSYEGKGVKEICHYDDDSILYLVNTNRGFYKIVKTNYLETVCYSYKLSIEPINESVARDLFFTGVDEEDINEEDFLEFIS